MQVVIPMAGRGQRFRAAGYETIKPLIEVDGRPMIEHVIAMFPGQTDFLFICASDHLKATALRSVLETAAPGGTIVGIEPHKQGPVYTALEARNFIKDNEPVILNYCDFFAGWDYEEFKREVNKRDCAGCMTAYRGFHPHSLGSNRYAYMREKDDYLLEIQEKHCFTENRMSEYASAGTYYFKSGALLKRAFDLAVERRLQTNGEYYASMPYNLLVEEGLDVYIYELDVFLQWGTPEDLEEYQAWSDYFTRFADWRPRRAPDATINLIPMAGSGARFRKESYADPKPLIPVAGPPMVQRSLDTVPSAKKWLAVCRTEHTKDPRLRPALDANGRKVTVLQTDHPTEGQLSTCLWARHRLAPEDPLLIAPCDAAVVYDEDGYARLTSDPDVDGLVWTFRNHPHANRYPKQYGWVRADAGGNVQGVSCKRPLDDIPRDPGVIGIFWFRRSHDFLEAADRLVAEDRRVNNEFYVDSVIDVMVQQGRRLRLFDVLHYVGLGTPDDLRIYEYWNAWFRRAVDHPFGKHAQGR